jgi:hypothetical protein
MTKKFMSYQKASALAQEAGLATRLDYLAWYKQVEGLPSNPVYVYSDVWQNWAVFLTGKDTIRKCSYQRAGEIARQHKIRKLSEYRTLSVQIPELPRYPEEFYKDEWVDFNTFITPPGVTILDYESARVELAKLRIQTEAKYKLMVKSDLRFPLNPARHYKDFWQGWHVFFWRPKPVAKYSFEEAKAAAKKLGIKSFNDYVHSKMYQLDLALPSTPMVYYKEWTDWDDFLDLNEPLRRTLGAYTFEEAKAVVKRMGLAKKSDYLKRYQEDPRLFASPKINYPEWISWRDYLGLTSQVNKISKVTYQEAKEIIIGYSLKSTTDYILKVKPHNRDPRLPSNPQLFYSLQGTWISWADFLGLSPEEDNYVPKVSYEEAKTIVSKLSLRSYKDWITHLPHKNDKRLPSNPQAYYRGKGTWVTWDDFLGTSGN